LNGNSKSANKIGKINHMHIAATHSNSTTTILLQEI